MDLLRDAEEEAYLAAGLVAHLVAGRTFAGIAAPVVQALASPAQAVAIFGAGAHLAAVTLA